MHGVDEGRGTLLARVDHGVYRRSHAEVLVAAVGVLNTARIRNLVDIGVGGALSHGMVVRVIRHVHDTTLVVVVEFHLLLAGLLLEEELVLIRLVGVRVLDLLEGSRDRLRGRLGRTALHHLGLG